MSNRADSLATEIAARLEEFDLSTDESVVYIKMLQSGKSTPLKLSKELRVPRTRIYRTLEKLVEKGFASEVVEGYGTKYQAESYDRLNIFVREKELEVEKLKEETERLFNLFAQLQNKIDSSSKIVHYRGIEGLKQVTHNTLKLKGDFRIYEVNLLHFVVDEKFAEDMRLAYSKMPYKFRQLTNQTSFDEYTNISAHIDQWEARHLPKDLLDIKFEIQIYNDITCMFEYTRDDVFIVEIYNDALAAMQKQIFDFVWEKATPMRKVGRRGRAVL